MSRLILILALAVAVYLLLRPPRAIPRNAGPSGRPEVAPPAEDMVRCVHCGVHLPMSEAIMARGQYYCSEAHRLAHRFPSSDGNAG